MTQTTEIKPPVQRKFGTYFGPAMESTEVLLRNAKRILVDVDFDTIVCTGASGMVFAPLLAHRMKKNLLIVRKDDDVNNHSGARNRFVGTMGERWLFVDDFIDTGATLDRVMGQIRKCADEWVYYVPKPGKFIWDTETVRFTPEYVGSYLYCRDTFNPAI